MFNIHFHLFTTKLAVISSCQKKKNLQKKMLQTFTQKYANYTE